jgi:hypothetical protein
MEIDKTKDLDKILQDVQKLIQAKKNNEVIKDSDYPYIYETVPLLYHKFKLDYNTTKDMDDKFTLLMDMISRFGLVKEGKGYYKDVSKKVSRDCAKKFQPELLKKAN